jgi:hypothetical protein
MNDDAADVDGRLAQDWDSLTLGAQQQSEDRLIPEAHVAIWAR